MGLINKYTKQNYLKTITKEEINKYVKDGYIVEEV